MFYASHEVLRRMASRGLQLHVSDAGTGIQSRVRNDSCVFVAAYAAKVLAAAPDVIEALADLHDRRAMDRHMPAVAEHARRMENAMAQLA